MMNTFNKVLLALFLVSVNSQDPVPALVCTEAFFINKTKIGGCEGFVTGELYDAYIAEGVADIMNVTLVPFGNAELNMATKTVTCQHGVEECEGNLWEMCAISLYPDFSVHFPFYYCLESEGSKMLNYVESCANSTGLDYNVLSACFNDPDEAWALEQEFAALTPSYHTYTPWVEVPTGTELEHQHTFLYTICENYQGALPAGCPQVSGHVIKKPDTPLPDRCPKNMQ